MTLEISSPDFSDWPPENTYTDKAIPNFVKGYLRMKVDAEWRATCLNDSSHINWLFPTFNWDKTIEYLIISQHIEAKDLKGWEVAIRERYDWAQKG